MSDNESHDSIFSYWNAKESHSSFHIRELLIDEKKTTVHLYVDFN